jgi:hypothetical protein
VTTTVSFRFTSAQFAIESAIVAFTKGARLFSDGEFRVGQVTDGEIEGVLVEGPIRFDAMLGNLAVVRHDDGRRYHVPFLPVTGRLSSQQLHAGCVVVDLDLPVVLIVRVEDSTGSPIQHVPVSLVLPHFEATLETRTDDLGQIALLAGAGHYSATIDSVPNRRPSVPISVELDITAADSGERILVLRVPSKSSPNP